MSATFVVAERQKVVNTINNGNLLVEAKLLAHKDYSDCEPQDLEFVFTVKAGGKVYPLFSCVPNVFEGDDDIIAVADSESEECGEIAYQLFNERLLPENILMISELSCEDQCPEFFEKFGDEASLVFMICLSMIHDLCSDEIISPDVLPDDIRIVAYLGCPEYASWIGKLEPSHVEMSKVGEDWFSCPFGDFLTWSHIPFNKNTCGMCGSSGFILFVDDL